MSLEVRFADASEIPASRAPAVRVVRAQDDAIPRLDQDETAVSNWDRPRNCCSGYGRAKESGNAGKLNRCLSPVGTIILRKRTGKGFGDELEADLDLDEEMMLIATGATICGEHPASIHK